MILGTGIDIVNLRRAEKMLARHPQRSPRRLLTKEERREFARRKHAPSYLAGRIAAKEALAKALRGGMRAPMRWQSASVLADESGAPHFIFCESLQKFLHARGVCACHLSLSHDGDYAAAVVVAEKQ